MPGWMEVGTLCCCTSHALSSENKRVSLKAMLMYEHLLWKRLLASNVILSQHIRAIFFHQNLGNKAKGSGVWLWATWRALFSNSLAETGIKIHSSPVLGNTGTAFQTTVVLQIWELRQRKKKSVIFTKISKKFEASSWLLPAPEPNRPVIKILTTITFLHTKSVDNWLKTRM